jgi:(1->4)-alpha-D-glucan 1-alpha-D-glucosylmutase
VATYRAQLSKDFPCEKARELLPFLKKLGISDLYCSPVFRARPGSTHGYDVVDPSQANPELGGEEGFAALASDLRSRGMGLLLDIVPNHMAATSRNAWWTDVLESGASSSYAAFFDVEWDPAWERGEEKIFLPVLGVPYGTALENQEIRLAVGEDGFSVNYYQIHLPVDPGTYGFIFESNQEGRPDSEDLKGLLESIARVPGRTTTSWEGIEARRREIPNVKGQLWSLYQTHSGVRSYIDAAITGFNGVKGDPSSFDLLDELLSRQAYRLAWWHGARERMNYRRFFDVSELIGVRVENPEVFAATHQAVLRWVAEGKVTGLRVDHIDGLFEPRVYLERLRALEQRPYLVVEKILLEDAELPGDWPVEGTTGYDFLGMVDGLFIDSANLPALANTYARFTGLNWSFQDAAYEQKRWIINHLFRGEMFALSLHLEIIADIDRYGRDLSPTALRRALADITACLPVYRTYLDCGAMPEKGHAYIEAAVAEARRRNPDVSGPVYDFLRRVLLVDFSRGIHEDGRKAWIRFVMRWQQLTGPITAKGIEDTTMYVYNRLISMNEVGGQHGEVTLHRFHQFNAARQQRWPATMNASSTHDTKRSEDARARISVLSELPSEWNRCLSRWTRWNRDKKTEIDGRAIPDGNEEILLYQTLIGVWPLHEGEIASAIDRVKQYIVKASREAKIYSSWIKPNEPHEQAVQRFLEAILNPDPGNRFRSHFLEFQARLAFFGAMNSLAATLVKITAPGIPDFYQNTESWDFSLVDPDNRRPVDVETRLRLAESMDEWSGQGVFADLLENWKDGRVKTWLIHRALEYRRDHAELFIEGEYVPLEAEGAQSGSVVAFARRRGSEYTITIVPRFMTHLGGSARPPLGRRAWKDTRLVLADEFAGPWMDAITQEKRHGAALSEILSEFPVALLTNANAAR